MQNNLDQDLLLKLIERVGVELGDYPTPHEARLNIENIRVLRAINTVVAGEGKLTPELVRERCPVFTSVYRNIMLREIVEHIPSGTGNTGRNQD